MKENTERRLSVGGLSIERNSDTDSNNLSGYAVVFDEDTTIGNQFTERVKRGAFDGVDMSKTFALFNHDWDKPLGKVGKNLSLSQDERGLKFNLELSNTSYAKDLIENVRSGIVEGCSFGFTIAEDSWTRSEDGGLPNRVIERVGELFEITLTHIPAYPTTEVAMRSMEKSLGEEIADVVDAVETTVEAVVDAVEECIEDIAEAISNETEEMVEDIESAFEPSEDTEEAPESPEVEEEAEADSEAPEEAEEEDEERATKQEVLEKKLAKKNGSKEPEAKQAEEVKEEPKKEAKPEAKKTAKKKGKESRNTNTNNSPKMEDNMTNADEIRSIAKDSVEGQAQNFDFGKLVRGLAKGNLTGLEAEIAQEGALEARNAGVQTAKGVNIPESVLRASTDNLIGANNWGGGAAPATQKFSGRNSAADIAAQLGIERLSGLTGNVLLPFVDKSLVATAAEGATAANTTSPFGTSTLTPQRFSGRVDVSGQLIAQSQVDLNGFLRNALLSEVDEAFSAYICDYIDTADDDVTGDDDAFALEARMLANNILPANIGVIAGTTAFKATRDQGIGLGGANLVVGQSPAARNSVLDYTTAVTSQMNSAAQMTMIDRSGFVVGEWGGLNIVVDNMTLAADDMYRVILNSYKDIKACKSNVAFNVTTYGTANV